MSGVLNGLIAAFPTPVTSSFESIATATGTGSSNTITFSSIPSTYKHLQIRGILRNTASAASIGSIVLTINGSSSSIYSYHFLDNASAFGYATKTNIYTSFGNNPSNGQLANTYGVIIIDIHNYASTSQYKTLRTFSGLDLNTGGGTVNIGSSLYQSTSAITSLSIATDVSNLDTSSTFALYGIKGA